MTTPMVCLLVIVAMHLFAVRAVRKENDETDEVLVTDEILATRQGVIGSDANFVPFRANASALQEISEREDLDNVLKWKRAEPSPATPAPTPVPSPATPAPTPVPSPVPRPTPPVPATSTCDRSCLLHGRSASCKSRITWLQNNKRETRERAIQTVNAECWGKCSCTSSDFSSAPPIPSPTPRPTPPVPATSTCDRNCFLHRKSASCKSRVTWLQNNRGETRERAIQTVNAECGGQCSCASSDFASPPPPAGPSPWPSPSSGSCGKGLNVKVLTYNLWWWKLFRERGGNGGSAGRLIARNNNPEYDFMGFQECEGDPNRPLRDGGLSGYSTWKAPHALAIAYKNTWQLLAKGARDVGEDKPGLWGRRGVQWGRFRHTSGAHVLLVNFHGPLPIGTGGAWGGSTTGSNIVKVAQEQAQPGDGVIIVGDFNSGRNTALNRVVEQSYKHIYSGRSHGGVDHIYSTCSAVGSPRNLGAGGSDHDALDAIIRM
eukprot:TRINITY_DN2479_c0_g1_i1.p1 TRINITY_DN2479_c0_g1~~TRINITY_DN2479_c0_g1_i1.p1  ORF type:complete len:519 (+),score=36.39 TRINITY_DN2479_c0_g1_i1:96-1559(+)